MKIWQPLTEDYEEDGVFIYEKGSMLGTRDYTTLPDTLRVCEQVEVPAMNEFELMALSYLLMYSEPISHVVPDTWYRYREIMMEWVKKNMEIRNK